MHAEYPTKKLFRISKRNKISLTNLICVLKLILPNVTYHLNNNKTSQKSHKNSKKRRLFQYNYLNMLLR